MKILLLFFIIGLLAAASCTTDYTNCSCNKSRLKANTKLDSAMRYTINYDSILLAYYHRAPIFQSNNETYRLSSIPFGSEYSQLITIQRTTSGATLTAEQFHTNQGLKWSPNLESQFIRKLTEAEWLDFRRFIFRKCFWATQKIHRAKDDQFLARWSLEGFDPTKNNCAQTDYHVDHVTHQDTTNIALIARKMLGYIEKSNFKNLESLEPEAIDTTQIDLFMRK